MQTLLDIFETTRRLGSREAIRYADGCRTRVWTYNELRSNVARFLAYLAGADLPREAGIVLWSENRPEWAAVFWAAVVRGLHVVPVDFQSTAGWAEKVRKETGAAMVVLGASVDGSGFADRCLALDDWESLPPADLRLLEVARRPSPSDIVEIVFTSGTTGEPRGVVHRHRNICANLGPFALEIGRYRAAARPFQPIRILEMLPLSHMFGQAMGLFIPILLEGAAAFAADFSPAEVMRTVRQNRISVLVAVPRLLLTLRRHIEQRFRLPPERPHRSGWQGILQRWWRHRRVHSGFGWKFWALTTGGAEVSREEEQFWGRLGFLLVQGYGLTETSPVVAVNHPFSNRPGSIGQILPGQEVRLAEDGEILVRGDNVVSGVLVGGREERVADSQGWLHTGDIGEFDSEGRLYFRGRKKDVIVTAEGLNVFPEDVEAELRRCPGIRDAAVVGIEGSGKERIHAALLLQEGADAPSAVRDANRALEPHQRVQSWSVWPEDDFPRTDSTLKVKRRSIAARLRGEPEKASGEGVRLESILADLTGTPSERIQDGTKLDEDLAISSLDRIELLTRIEAAYNVSIEEPEWNALKTVGELRGHLRSATQGESPESGGLSKSARPAAAEPRVSYGFDYHGAFSRAFRRLILETIVLRALEGLIQIRVDGLRHLEPLEGPVLFAANHVSDLDTPTIFAALPSRRRYRLAPAIRKEFFLPSFHPDRYPASKVWTNRFHYFLSAVLFAAFPLPQRPGGIREALRRMGKLVDDGYSLLVYPEGRRAKDGKLLPFQPGIGLMAERLRLPVVPVFTSGLFEVYSAHDRRPRPGRVSVEFGPPLRKQPETSPSDFVRQVESWFEGMELRP